MSPRRSRRAALRGAAAAALLVALAACRPVGAPPPPEPLAPASEYVSARRCDGPAALSGGPSTVHLVGNSVANEVAPCLTTILKSNRNATLFQVANAGAALCDLFRDGGTGNSAVDSYALKQPNLVIIHAWHGGSVDERPCMKREGQPPLVQWVNDTKRIVDIYRAARPDVKVLLVPQGVPAGQRGVDAATVPYASNIANPSSGYVRMGDVGRYVREGNLWTWRAVCISGEVGCDANGAIPVRMLADGGVHFCREPVPDAGPCPPGHAGGTRRAAASIATTALTLLP